MVPSGNALKELPFAVYQRQQVGEVGFRAAIRFVFSLGPIDHRVGYESRYISLEAFRQLLALRHGEVGQIQTRFELFGVEQPDQDMHHHRVRKIQSGIAVGLHIFQIFGQQFVTLELLTKFAAVDRADSLQILSQGGFHQLQVLLTIGRAG